MDCTVLRLKGTAYIKHRGRADKGHSGGLTGVLPTRWPHGTIDGRARGTSVLRVVLSLDPRSERGTGHANTWLEDSVFVYTRTP